MISDASFCSPVWIFLRKRHRTGNKRAPNRLHLLLLFWRQSSKEAFIMGVCWWNKFVLSPVFFFISFQLQMQSINMREKHLYIDLIGRKYGCNCLKQNYFFVSFVFVASLAAFKIIIGKLSQMTIIIKSSHLNT